MGNFHLWQLPSELTLAARQAADGACAAHAAISCATPASAVPRDTQPRPGPVCAAQELVVCESAVLADAAAVFILPCAPLKGWLSQLPVLCRPAQASGPGCRLRTGCARRPTWTAPTTAAPGALSSPQAAKTVLPTGNAEPYAGAATWALGFRQRCRLLRLKLTTLHYPSCDAEAAIRALGGRQRCRQLALELTLWHHPSCDTEPAPGCIHLECNSSSLPGVFVDC